MDHQRLKPIKGASAREKTAFTLKTIQELLAEELAVPEAEPAKEAQAEPAKGTQAAAQTPAQASEPEKVEHKTKAEALPPIAPLEEKAQPEAEVGRKKGSLFGRLIGR